jgi:hypothetical protein
MRQAGSAGRRTGKWAGALAALALFSTPAAAQSRELVSLQVSGEVVFPTEDYGVLESSATLGWEAQARLTFGRFSVGAGYQRSTVFKSDVSVGEITATLSVGFVEPRYVLGVFGNVAAPYLAARLGYGGLLIRSANDQVQSTEESFIYGGGLGVIFQVATRVGIDVGAQYFVADFTDGQGSAGYFLTRLGVSVGLF